MYVYEIYPSSWEKFYTNILKIDIEQIDIRGKKVQK